MPRRTPQQVRDELGRRIAAGDGRPASVIASELEQEELPDPLVELRHGPLVDANELYRRAGFHMGRAMQARTQEERRKECSEAYGCIRRAGEAQIALITGLQEQLEACSPPPAPPKASSRKGQVIAERLGSLSGAEDKG